MLPTRILYLIDEASSDFTRSGFAYGTVQGHWEHGEERFLVEWDRRDDSVWYDLLVFSPAAPAGEAGVPYTRYEQARFRRLSCAAMLTSFKTGKILITPVCCCWAMMAA